MFESIMTILPGSIVECHGTLAEVVNKRTDGKTVVATLRTNDGDFEERFYLPSGQGTFRVAQRAMLRMTASQMRAHALLAGLDGKNIR
ncbi:hypothetical protein [Streptomyces fungicidicus]|uniref:hypothetical protein n=1 Tax=Streptomyces fungicidicus TaxID=68203 RepID=UPI0036BB11ED